MPQRSLVTSCTSTVVRTWANGKANGNSNGNARKFSPRQRRATVARRFRKREDPVSVGLWRRKSAARNSSRARNCFRSSEVKAEMKVWLILGVLLSGCGAISAQNEPPRVRNIVLVHGAWADGSGWKGVYDILVKDGYKVSIVQEPETSFKEDVAATKRILAQQDGSCILVAHSYGGAV